MFVHLRVKTEFSLLNSVLRIEDIANFSKENNVKSIAMMDDFSLSGSLQFSSYLSKISVKPIIGLNIGLISNEMQLNGEKKTPTIGLLVQSQNGYQNLLKILYNCDLENQKTSLGEVYLKTSDFLKYNFSDIICISGGYNGTISRDFLEDRNESANILCENLLNVFKDKFYIELTRHGREKEFELENFLIDLAYKYNIPLVATNDVHFLKKEQFEAYDALSCIASNRYIIENERNKLNENYYLKTESEMKELFSDLPEAIKNTTIIAKRCNFFVEGNKPMLPSFGTEGETENEMLRRVSNQGLKERIQECKIKDEKKYFDRLEYELSVIEKMGFAGYFLIVSDFIQWAKNNNVPVGPGRGSGAGSIIAWSTKITNLDPIHYGLLFERFLNPDRVSMPDFDIDFCQSKRDLVIDYVKNKYGTDRVASIITFGKLQAKAVLKDVGRVMQLSYGMVDEVCKMIPFSPLEPITIQKAINMDPNLQEQVENDPDISNLVRIGMELEGLNRHHSTHAAGIIISSVDLLTITPLLKDDKSTLPVLAYNMKDAEKMGLLKFDFLGLKTLTIIQQACDLIKENQNIYVDIDKISVNDEKTFNLLGSGKLKGIFQFEASIPREILAKTKPNSIEDLTAVTSLCRPGPMENIPDYVRRKTGQEQPQYPHPLLEKCLKETLGIIIYQEQVMEVAKILAGYTLAEADLLRRAMGKKIKEEMDQQKQIFANGAKKNNIDEKKAIEIFELVEKFAGYGFNKSHGAAYCVISYQTAYLKANYPIEFFVANLNLEMHDTDKINEFISDAKAFGIEVKLPDINTSEAYFSISQDKKSILYGLGALKAVGLGSSEKIAQERKEKGNFKDILDFAEKCGHQIANKRQLESLIYTGCFDGIHNNRKKLIESVESIVKYASEIEKSKESNQVGLFSLIGSETSFFRPNLKNINEDYLENEKIAKEFEFIGFYLSSHPLNKYTDLVNNSEILKSSELDSIQVGIKKQINMLGVITKITQRFKKTGRFCFVQLSDLDGMYEVAIFSTELVINLRDFLFEGNLVFIEASVSRDDGGLRLVVNNMKNIDDIKDTKKVIQKTNDHYLNFIKKETKKKDEKIDNPVKNIEKKKMEKEIKEVIIECKLEELKIIKSKIKKDQNGNKITILCNGMILSLKDLCSLENLNLEEI